MDFVERIDQKLKEKNLKRAAMLEDIGVDISLMTAWKKRGTIPSGAVCLKIAKYLGVSAEWLISGEETKDYIPAEEKKRLSMLRELTPEQRHTIDVLLNDFEKTNMETFKKDLG